MNGAIAVRKPTEAIGAQTTNTRDRILCYDLSSGKALKRFNELPG
jgi:hypothetical protein